MAEQLRLFFALWPDESVRVALQSALPPVGPGGRVVSRANWHVTLAFLGNVAADRLASLVELASAVHGQPFTMTLDRWEEWNRSLVAFVPSATPPALTSLVGELNAQLAAANLPTEARPYRAHITVIRERRRGSGRREGLLAADAPQAMLPIKWTVDDFVLVKSVPGREGSSYEVLQRWPLLVAADQRD
jgi:2'-5' RNA ligase